jgi:hypothetical protein
MTGNLVLSVCSYILVSVFRYKQQTIDVRFREILLHLLAPVPISETRSVVRIIVLRSNSTSWFTPSVTYTFS